MAQVALEQVRRGARILVGAAALARGERGREALVVRLDGNVDDVAERIDERLRLERLRAALAAQRQRQPDDDALDLVLTHERRDLGEPVADAARATTPSGRAIVPVASETATPVRAAP